MTPNDPHNLTRCAKYLTPGSRKRRPRSLSLMAGALIAAALTACSRQAADERPAFPGRNVVLVTIDTLRADHVGFYHYGRDTTPNIDRLARKAVSFGNAVSTSSWTLPAHASILTGLYPAEHGVVTDTSALPPSAPTLATILSAHGYDTFAAVSHVYLSHRWGFDRGFATFDDSAAAGSPQRPVAARVVDRALSWLAERKSDKPFFMWLHIFDPHWDYAPPAPFDRKFDPDYRGTMRGDYASLKPYIKAVAGYETPPPLAKRDLEHLIALYDGEIAYADNELGRLFDRLGQPDLAGNTVISVLSDHGEEFMEHGSLEGHQWTLFDEVVLVPWILYLPEQRFQGIHLEPEVSTVTVAGTLLDYLGIDNDRPSVYDALLHPKRHGIEPEALLDLTIRHKKRVLGLRLVNFKLLRYDDGTLELFRIPHRSERTNEVDHYPGIAKRMSQRIDELLAGMNRLPDAGTQRQPLDAATRERLRATGYLR